MQIFFSSKGRPDVVSPFSLSKISSNQDQRPNLNLFCSQLKKCFEFERVIHPWWVNTKHWTFGMSIVSNRNESNLKSQVDTSNQNGSHVIDSDRYTDLWLKIAVFSLSTCQILCGSVRFEMVFGIIWTNVQWLVKVWFV